MFPKHWSEYPQPRPLVYKLEASNAKPKQPRVTSLIPKELLLLLPGSYNPLGKQPREPELTNVSVHTYRACEMEC